MLKNREKIVPQNLPQLTSFTLQLCWAAPLTQESHLLPKPCFHHLSIPVNGVLIGSYPNGNEASGLENMSWKAISPKTRIYKSLFSEYFDSYVTPRYYFLIIYILMKLTLWCIIFFSFFPFVNIQRLYRKQKLTLENREVIIAIHGVKKSPSIKLLHSQKMKMKGFYIAKCIES